MRYLLFAAFIFAILISCNKGKYTTAPQIKFKSITETFLSGNLGLTAGPKLTIEVTDAEGDLGFKEDKDSSYVFIKNLTVPPFKIDSFPFPTSLASVARKDFKADIEISLGGDGTAGSGVLAKKCTTSGCTDTLFFEVYVRDFAKNKSNVIKTEKPLYYITP